MLSNPRHWSIWKNIEPWYWGYCFQGAVVLGLAPILLPILVHIRSGSSSQAGWVVAAFYLGMLPAPLFGVLADKTKKYAVFYLGGYLLIGIGCAMFPFVGEPGLWMGMAFLQGAGAGAINTLAAMYIIEFRPKDQWDGRIGWLQTINGTGQAAGLGLAALFQVIPGWGLWLSAVFMVPGFFLGRLRLPSKREHHEAEAGKSVHPDHPDLPHRHCLPTPGVSHSMHFYHMVDYQHFLKFIRTIWSKFGLYMLSWFLTMFGMWMVMNLLPLLFHQAYGIRPWLSSLLYAIAATVGIFFYAPSGIWGKKFGDARVLFSGMLGLVFSLIGLAALVYLPNPNLRFYLAPAAFFLIPIAWSPLIVAGTAYAGAITNIGQGAGIGVFNAVLAIAAVLSAVAAGQVAEYYDYGTVSVIAAIIGLFGLILFIPLLFLKKQ